MWSTPPLGTPPKPIGSWRGTPSAGMAGKNIGSLRQPTPSWSAIPGTGMMLLPQQNGILVGKKQTIVETVNPIAQDYDCAPIYKERTFVFKPNAGMGERQQSSTLTSATTSGSTAGSSAACSARVRCCTPSPRRRIHRADPPVHRGLNADRTALRLFMLAGPNILQRNDDSNAGQARGLSRAGRSPRAPRAFRRSAPRPWTPSTSPGTTAC